MNKKKWQTATLAGLMLLCLEPLGNPAYAQISGIKQKSQKVPDINLTPGETAYTLGPGDRLKVDIFQVQEYSGEYLVLVDGTVSLPLIGSFKVEGMTLPTINKIVTEKYKRFIKRPIATVSLIAPRPLKLAISGEVNNPGSYTVDLDKQKEQKFPSVTDLITRAGGLTTAADIRQVQIRRIYNGKEQVAIVDLWQLLQQGRLTQDVTLRDGDAVIIPTSDRIDDREVRQLADASFGIKIDKPINVAVVGEVNRPGSYIIKPERDNLNNTPDAITKFQPPRLSQALSQAGGIRPLADLRNIQVQRFTRAGNQQLIAVNLWELLKKGDPNGDIILQSGDTIVIPQAQAIDPKEAESLASASFSPSTIKIQVVGEVKNAGAVDVPPNTPLNQALLAAGGFDQNRAEKSTVELVRLNPNGTVSKREIAVDFSSPLNEQNNPALRSNDVLVVKRSGLTKTTDTLGSIFNPLAPILGILNFLF